MQFPLEIISEAGSVCLLDLYFSALEEVLIPCLILGIASVPGRKLCTDLSIGKYFINQVLTDLLAIFFPMMVIFAPKRCCLQFYPAQVHCTSLSGGRGSGAQPVSFRKGTAFHTRPPASRTDADTELLLTSFFYLLGFNSW